MHKRARNHHLLVYCRKADKKLFKDTREKSIQSLWKEWGHFMYKYGGSVKYEPQGKREAKKYTKGLLYYVPSTFN